MFGPEKWDTKKIIGAPLGLINWRSGSIGALIMGGLIFWINREHGTGPALIAALKQGAYTLLLGGALIRLLQIIVSRPGPAFWRILFGTFLVSILTIGLVWIVHHLRGTPEPFNSTLPTIILAPPGFLVLAILFQRRNSRVDRSHFDSD